MPILPHRVDWWTALICSQVAGFFQIGFGMGGPVGAGQAVSRQSGLCHAAIIRLAVAGLLAFTGAGAAAACIEETARRNPGEGSQSTALAGQVVEIVDRSAEHRVVAGDTLTSIGARYGVEPRLVAEANRLDPDAWLRVGQRLRIESRHLAGHRLPEGLVINLPQRMLLLFRGGRVAGAWPVAVGRPDWPTPTGSFTVVSLETDKTWYVPLSIQREMQREGLPVLTRVPPGPDNPLGRHWIGLSLPAIGIHGTIAPASIYGFRSHGCIRMHPDDVADLFGRVSRGEPGRIVYEPLAIGRDGSGRIWFQASPDAYRRSAGSLDEVRAMATARGIDAGQIAWDRVRSMLTSRDGLARTVGIGLPAGGEAGDRESMKER
jgi:L,D-transpeptidase ErfK/SrfK